MMPFHVSLVGRKDLSGEIYRQIRRAILDDRLRSGDRLSPDQTTSLSKATNQRINIIVPLARSPQRSGR
jgi:GntR family transcriptional regulator / MocR family aminotransferase